MLRCAAAAAAAAQRAPPTSAANKRINSRRTCYCSCCSCRVSGCGVCDTELVCKLRSAAVASDAQPASESKVEPFRRLRITGARGATYEFSGWGSHCVCSLANSALVVRQAGGGARCECGLECELAAPLALTAGWRVSWLNGPQQQVAGRSAGQPGPATDAAGSPPQQARRAGLGCARLACA